MATQVDTQILTGWKAIAAFIKRDERTAMRWASTRGLPVRRVPGGRRGPVYAVPEEIARWLDLTDGAEPEERFADEREPVSGPTADLPEPASAVSADADDSGCAEARDRPLGSNRNRRLLTVALLAAMAGSAVTAGAITVVDAPLRGHTSSCTAPAARGR